MRPWLYCWVGWCGGHVESDETDIWWQCARCGRQRHRAKRLSFESVIQKPTNPGHDDQGSHATPRRA